MTARLLVIMGSGETTPTMVKVHRQVFAALEQGGAVGSPLKAVLLSTPYGFQTNARDISARAVTYFKDSVGREVDAVSLVPPEAMTAHRSESALARVAGADWVFSGPGSPTYAVGQWRPTSVPHLLEEKLLHGGAVVFSSAAAMTLGRWTVPVYEVYKAGVPVIWSEGLDLLSRFGLPVAVIAHFNNAEGGHHDTRYCYLGEERLRVLEYQLPAEAWVLGVDEHTAAIFDLEAGTVSVAGLGVLTLRAHGEIAVIEAGESVTMAELSQVAGGLLTKRGGLGTASVADAGTPGTGTSSTGTSGTGTGGTGEASNRTSTASNANAGSTANDSATGDAGTNDTGGGAGMRLASSANDPLLVEVRRLNLAFDGALANRDIAAAMGAVFDLEQALHAWSTDTFESDHVDRARGALRRMLARLGELAAEGMREPRSIVAPWADALLVERDEARLSKRFSDSDRIRDALAKLGVEVRDTAEGSHWDLRPASNQSPR